LADPLSLTWYDEEYSVEEDRYLTIGVSDNFQTLIVSHTYCGGLVRIISVRPATRQEIRDCEDGSSSK